MAELSTPAKCVITMWSLLFWLVILFHPIMKLFRRSGTLFNLLEDPDHPEYNFANAFEDKFWKWLCFLLLFICFVYGEGYRAFHLHFSPMVIKRTLMLVKSKESNCSRTVYCFLAPFLAAGLCHATRSRLAKSWSIAIGVPLLVIGVMHLPFPWREFIDFSVSAALSIGLLSGFYFYVVYLFQGTIPDVPHDFPPESQFASCLLIESEQVSDPEQVIDPEQARDPEQVKDPEPQA